MLKKLLIILTLVGILIGVGYGSKYAGEEIDFIYLGDTQKSIVQEEGYKPLEEILSSAKKSSPTAELVIIGGDLINDDDQKEEWNDFFRAVKKHFPNNQIKPVVGNHTARGSLLKMGFKLPQNGPEISDAMMYSFDKGAAHFIMLDSMIMGTRDEKTVNTLKLWIEKDLSASRKTWKIVIMHHPMVSVSGISKDEIRAKTMRENYLPLFEKYGIDLILCGHQHVYSRLEIGGEKEGKTEGKNKIIQIMSVSNTKFYKSAVTQEQNKVVKKIIEDKSLYSILHVGIHEIKIETKDAQGHMWDNFVLKNNE